MARTPVLETWGERRAVGQAGEGCWWWYRPHPQTSATRERQLGVRAGNPRRQSAEEHGLRKTARSEQGNKAATYERAAKLKGTTRHTDSAGKLQKDPDIIPFTTARSQEQGPPPLQLWQEVGREAPVG